MQIAVLDLINIFLHCGCFASVYCLSGTCCTAAIVCFLLADVAILLILDEEFKSFLVMEAQDFIHMVSFCGLMQYCQGLKARQVHLLIALLSFAFVLCISPSLVVIIKIF